MRHESVAILDIRSNEISFLLGAKGVNGTFVFSGMHSEKYEGCFLDGFLDEASFRRAVIASITAVVQNYEGTIGEIYVGVPSAFVTLRTKGHTQSFFSKRKVMAQDVDALFESGMNDLLGQGVCIRRSAMYFSLGDNRKYFSAKDLYGVPTTMLKGALCYYFVSEDFYASVCGLLSEMGFANVHFIPSTLAQASYLLSERKREGYAFLLDVGFLTSSVSVVYGNGIVHEETFDCGVGSILVALIENLGVELSVAEAILASANISGGSVPQNLKWNGTQGEGGFFVQQINDVIKCGLDELCEKVENFFMRHYQDKTPISQGNAVSVTGEGVMAVKGAAEHISHRLNRLTEIVYPDLPYYDKPNCSSRIALLHTAIGDCEKQSWFRRILNNFGGKKK